MPVPRRRRPIPLAFALGALLSLVAACGEDNTGTIEPPEPTPLTPGDWYMHTANGNALPGAEIARRFVGVVDEQTLLDSARLQVSAEGSYEQRYWTRTFHGGVLDRSEVVVDIGTWDTDGPVSTFISTLRARSFEVTANAADRATSDEPMVFFPNATNVTGVYRTTPP
jgi:hypothetical protein